MIFKKGMSLIITIVNAGFSQMVVEASKKIGAEGATILSGRGIGKHETTSVLGVQIQPEKEVVLILVRKSFRKDVMKSIVRECDQKTESRALTFCLPVDEIASISHLFKNGTFKKLDEEKLKQEEKCDAEEKEKQTEEVKKEQTEEPKIETKTQEEKTQKPEQKVEEKQDEKVEKKTATKVKKIATKTNNTKAKKAKETKADEKPKKQTKKVVEKTTKSVSKEPKKTKKAN